MDSEEFIRNTFFHPVGKKINDEALTEMINFLNFVDINFDDKIDRNDKKKLRYAEVYSLMAIEIAHDARRNNVILEDLQIMFLSPKEDISIEKAPIKRFINSNSSKKISDNASKFLISELDDECVEILKCANEISTEKGHETITLSDIKEIINKK